MFKHLQQHQSSGGFVERVANEFLEMLDLAETIFSDVCVRLFEHERKPHLGDKVYEIDARINELERIIRRHIVEHLTLQPKADRQLCLALMSLVKDAERLGDNIKNLYEVDHILGEPIDDEHYTDYFGSMAEEIKALFPTTRSALTDDSQEDTNAAREAAHRIEKTCDAIIERLAHCDLVVKEAVAFTLLARHFKRTAAHLGNIVTSVTHPLADFDYRVEE